MDAQVVLGHRFDQQDPRIAPPVDPNRGSEASLGSSRALLSAAVLSRKARAAPPPEAYFT
jgi:hypothetical protein